MMADSRSKEGLSLLEKPNNDHTPSEPSQWDKPSPPMVPSQKGKACFDHVAKAVFFTLSEYECGVIKTLPDVPFMPCPENADRATRKVWESVELLFRVRWFRYPGAPVPLARRFITLWAGVSEWEARIAVDALIVSGAVRLVAVMRNREEGWLRLFLPAGVPLSDEWSHPEGMRIEQVRPRAVKAKAAVPRMPAILHRAVVRCLADLHAAKGARREAVAKEYLAKYVNDWCGRGIPLVRVKSAKTLMRHLTDYLRQHDIGEESPKPISSIDRIPKVERIETTDDESLRGTEGIQVLYVAVKPVTVEAGSARRRYHPTEKRQSMVSFSRRHARVRMHETQRSQQAASHRRSVHGKRRVRVVMSR